MILLVQMLRTARVSINGMAANVSYTFNSIQDVQGTQLFEKVETDYFIARRADEYLHGKTIYVGLHK